jgi:hypothetical protein
MMRRKKSDARGAAVALLLGLGRGDATRVIMLYLIIGVRGTPGCSDLLINRKS